jgi:hypothetical protein
VSQQSLRIASEPPVGPAWSGHVTFVFVQPLRASLSMAATKRTRQRKEETLPLGASSGCSAYPPTCPQDAWVPRGATSICSLGLRVLRGLANAYSRTVPVSKLFLIELGTRSFPLLDSFSFLFFSFLFFVSFLFSSFLSFHFVSFPFHFFSSLLFSSLLFSSLLFPSFSFLFISLSFVVHRFFLRCKSSFISHLSHQISARRNPQHAHPELSKRVGNEPNCEKARCVAA